MRLLRTNLNTWLNGNVSMVAITRIAEDIATARNLKIDRMARRIKDAMMCWLCENAPELVLGTVPDCLQEKGFPLAFRQPITALPTGMESPPRRRRMPPPIEIECPFSPIGRNMGPFDDADFPGNWDFTY
jgi:hypothetical protein